MRLLSVCWPMLVFCVKYLWPLLIYQYLCSLVTGKCLYSVNELTLVFSFNCSMFVSSVYVCVLLLVFFVYISWHVYSLFILNACLYSCIVRSQCVPCLPMLLYVYWQTFVCYLLIGQCLCSMCIGLCLCSLVSNDFVIVVSTDWSELVFFVYWPMPVVDVYWSILVFSDHG